MSFGGDTGNSLDSHRLIAWALEQGGPAAQDRVVEALFSAYLEQERNPARRETLVACAAEAGLDAARAGDFLDSGALTEETVKEEKTLRQKHRITGVPYFIFGDASKKFALSGAQDIDTFVDTIATAAGIDVDDLSD
jgi:predicted DsbA family dithiol-disulfide isomerase